MKVIPKTFSFSMMCESYDKLYLLLSGPQIQSIQNTIDTIRVHNTKSLHNPSFCRIHSKYLIQQLITTIGMELRSSTFMVCQYNNFGKLLQ